MEGHCAAYRGSKPPHLNSFLFIALLPKTQITGNAFWGLFLRSTFKSWTSSLVSLEKIQKQQKAGAGEIHVIKCNTYRSKPIFCIRLLHRTWEQCHATATMLFDSWIRFMNFNVTLYDSLFGCFAQKHSELQCWSPLYDTKDNKSWTRGVAGPCRTTLLLEF